MERFSKIVDGFELLTVFTKRPSYMFDKVLNMPLGYILDFILLHFFHIKVRLYKLTILKIKISVKESDFVLNYFENIFH